MMLCIDAHPRQRGGDDPADLSVPQHIGNGTFTHHDCKMGGNLFLAFTSLPFSHIPTLYFIFRSTDHASISLTSLTRSLNAQDGSIYVGSVFMTLIRSSGPTTEFALSLSTLFNSIRFSITCMQYTSLEGFVGWLLYR